MLTLAQKIRILEKTAASWNAFPNAGRNIPNPLFPYPQPSNALPAEAAPTAQADPNAALGSDVTGRAAGWLRQRFASTPSPVPVPSYWKQAVSDSSTPAGVLRAFGGNSIPSWSVSPNPTPAENAAYAGSPGYRQMQAGAVSDNLGRLANQLRSTPAPAAKPPQAPTVRVQAPAAVPTLPVQAQPKAPAQVAAQAPAAEQPAQAKPTATTAPVSTRDRYLAWQATKAREEATKARAEATAAQQAARAAGYAKPTWGTQEAPVDAERSARVRALFEGGRDKVILARDSAQFAGRERAEQAAMQRARALSQKARAERVAAENYVIPQTTAAPAAPAAPAVRPAAPAAPAAPQQVAVNVPTASLFGQRKDPLPTASQMAVGNFDANNNSNFAAPSWAARERVRRAQLAANPQAAAISR